MFQGIIISKQNPDWVGIYNPKNPPDVLFDTNVWISMNDNDINTLERLRNQHGFQYRYSITNYVEIVSHLDDPPSKEINNPFRLYQKCLNKIINVCHREVLPSPEMELLNIAGLEHYLDPVWIPSPTDTIKSIEIIINVNDIDGIRQVINPCHYSNLREIDGNSFQKVMLLLGKITPPILSSDNDKLKKLIKWFWNLVNFFFLVRPSNKKINYDRLRDTEKRRFCMAFIDGVGNLFFNHCISVVKKILNDGKKVDPNDLYDMMQLILLRDLNRWFVTGEKSFFHYQADPQIQRVLPWSSFRTSG